MPPVHGPPVYRAHQRFIHHIGILAVVVGAGSAARADNYLDIGMYNLHAVQPTLTGAGVIVAIPESPSFDRTDPQHPIDLKDFEINPNAAGFVASPLVSAPITYVFSATEQATTFPNSIGFEFVPNLPHDTNSHADQVAFYFVGLAGGGPSPGVSAIWNYDANYFLQLISAGTPIPAKVVNQSFTILANDANEAAIDLQVYDNYVASTGKIIVTAAAPDMNGFVALPGGAYNLLTVSSAIANFSSGTTDGRTKPDISATGSIYPSITTPVVSGAATLLVQAGNMGLGGSGTQSSAVDPRTIKALLLTGATKTNTWTHTSTAPLDLRYGAGIVNVYSSYLILHAGMKLPTLANVPTVIGQPHVAINAGTPVGSFGWNFQGINSTAATDTTDHYLINLSPLGKNYVFTATLDWWRPYNPNQVTTINNLDLFLYNTATNTQVAISASTIDNVEHLYVPALPPGQYDLQVLKHGGFTGTANVVQDNEMYGLAWSAPLLGDANWNGIVDIQDLTIVANNWQTARINVFNGDLSGDGVVDIQDLTIVANNWQASGNAMSLMPGDGGSQGFDLNAGTQGVPEPAAIGVLGLGCVGLLMRRRRA